MVATIRRALASLVDRVRTLEGAAEEGARASSQLDAATRTITNLQDLTGYEGRGWGLECLTHKRTLKGMGRGWGWDVSLLFAH